MIGRLRKSPETVGFWTDSMDILGEILAGLEQALPGWNRVISN
jgi:hypothetical protein